MPHINLKGRGSADRKSDFIAGRPKAAILFWFFGGFRSVRYKNRKKVNIDVYRCLMLD